MTKKLRVKCFKYTIVFTVVFIYLVSYIFPSSLLTRACAQGADRKLGVRSRRGGVLVDGGFRGLGVVWCLGVRMKSVVPRLSSGSGRSRSDRSQGVCHGQWAPEVMKCQISAGGSGLVSVLWCATLGAYLLFLIWGFSLVRNVGDIK